MQSTFDPYYRWLGIPPEEQPPNHYRLLGLRLFEADLDVIETAADRQMRHLQTFKTGQHSGLSQTLLNEVAAARLCLLTAAKEKYDAGLKSALPAPPSPATVAVVPQAVAIALAPPTPLINTQPQTAVAEYRKKSRSRSASQWSMLALVLACLGVFAAAAWAVWWLQPTAPKLPVLGAQSLDEGQTLSLSFAPADFDQRGGKLAFELLGGTPSNVKLDSSTGLLTWTPDESQGPGNYRLRVRGSVVGSPHLYDESAVDVSVAEVHQPPQLEPIELRRAGRGIRQVLLHAKDLDLPRGKIAYSVQVVPTPTAPPTLSEAGQFVWRPAPDDFGKEFQLTFRAAKAGLAECFSEQSLKVRLPGASDGEHFGREEFVAALQRAGAAVQHAREIVPAMFGGNRHAYRIDQKIVDLTEYASVHDAAAAIAQLKPREGRFANRTLSLTGPTHFFHKERLLAIYAGDDEAVLGLLTKVLGQPLGVGLPANTMPPPKPAAGGETNSTAVPQTAVPKRLDEPAPEEQSSALDEIKKLYADRFGLKKPEDRIALAKTLYAEGLKSAARPAVRFVLWQQSVELSAAAGDVAQAWQAADLLISEYDVNAFDLKLAALKKAAGFGRSGAAEHLEVAQCYGELVESAVIQERFADATALIAPALGAANRAKDNRLATRIQKRGRELAEQHKAFDAAQAARQKLNDAPDDGQANSHWGSYLCLWSDNWAEGLPFLAKSNSLKLAEAARLEINLPTTAAQQRALGEAWLAASELARGMEKEALAARAQHWYRLALPQLNGADKNQVQKRVDAIPPRSGPTPLGKPINVQSPQVAAAAAAANVASPRAKSVELPAPPQADEPNLDRLVAEAVLKFPPSQVMVQVDQQRSSISQATQLPEQPFELKGVVLVGRAVDDSLLAWLRNLKHLDTLYLAAGTSVSDAGLAHLAELASLRAFQIHCEQLSDEALKHLGKLTGLQSLHLANGRYTDAGVTALAGLNNLITLQLPNSKCTDEGLAQLKQMPQLQNLSVGSDAIQGRGLEHLRGLPRLSNLTLECPNLADDSLDQLAACPDLRVLSLRGKMTDAAWTSLGKLGGLLSLSLDSPRLTSAGMENISKLANLQVLTLRASGPVLNDEALATIARLPQLRSLSAERCEEISSAGLASLAQAPQLQTIRLQQTRQITDAGLAPLAQKASLRNISLQDAVQIGDAGLLHFQKSTQLQSLHISGSRITDEGLKALRESLPKCSITK